MTTNNTSPLIRLGNFAFRRWYWRKEKLFLFVKYCLLKLWQLFIKSVWSDHSLWAEAVLLWRGDDGAGAELSWDTTIGWRHRTWRSWEEWEVTIVPFIRLRSEYRELGRQSRSPPGSRCVERRGSEGSEPHTLPGDGRSLNSWKITVNSWKITVNS